MSEDDYFSRVARIADMMSPDVVFVSTSDIQEALKIIAESKEKEGDAIKPKDALAAAPSSPTSSSSAGSAAGVVSGMTLARAKRIESACIHPDTGEVIFAPLRLSMILPMNALLTLMMMHASTLGSVPLISLAQLANQTYNVTHYYANRNATSSSSTSVLAQSYVAAVAASLSTSYGIERLARTSKHSRALRFVGPFLSVALANVFNMSLMRQSEYLQGVAVKDAFGDVMGVSQSAGLIGVGSCIVGRVLAAMPSMVLPALIQDKLVNTVLKPYPRMHLPVFFGIICATIQTTVPLGLGAFKQHTHVEVERLETPFQKWKQRDGSIAKFAYFNKGI